jgi:hypothetical protein
MTIYNLTASTTILRDDGAHIPADPMNTDYAAYLTWVADGGVPTPYVATPAPPISCSAWQIRAALSQMGLRAEAESAVVASTNLQLKDAWGYQETFTEGDQMLLSIAAVMGKTAADVHNLIALGQTIMP